MHLVGCHECDAVMLEPECPDGGAVYCARCGALLFRRHQNTVEVTLALVCAGAILFAVANGFPFLAFELGGQVTQTTLFDGTRDLWRQGRQLVSALVFLTTILAPAMQIGLLIYVLAPLHFGRRAPAAIAAFRGVDFFRPWSMMEVFLIGILVSVVKLADMAEIVPGVAIWAFGLLIPVLAAAQVSLDSELVWRRLDEGA